ncbi:hypothetical protein LDENG_00131900 [Lucifuga dentata]|nr:hypothetical protein LDENG_00131900 [Lucifuga dentata]
MYDPNKNIKVSADTSFYGLGVVLLQKWGDEWSPVAYAFCSLSSTEQCYAQMEKEALSLTWACEQLRDFFLGKHFVADLFSASWEHKR